jgi:hypothetical protein
MGHWPKQSIHASKIHASKIQNPCIQNPKSSWDIGDWALGIGNRLDLEPNFGLTTGDDIKKPTARGQG